MSKIYLKQTTGELKTSSATAVPIEGLKVNIDLPSLRAVSISFTAPDTWVDTAGSWTWFELRLDGRLIPKAVGLSSAAVAGQRIPVHVETDLNILNGRHEITAHWLVKNGGAASIGNSGAATLRVMVYDDGTTVE